MTLRNTLISFSGTSGIQVLTFIKKYYIIMISLFLISLISLFLISLFLMLMSHKILAYFINYIMEFNINLLFNVFSLKLKTLNLC